MINNSSRNLQISDSSEISCSYPHLNLSKGWWANESVTRYLENHPKGKNSWKESPSKRHRISVPCPTFAINMWPRRWRLWVVLLWTSFERGFFGPWGCSTFHILPGTTLCVYFHKFSLSPLHHHVLPNATSITNSYEGQWIQGLRNKYFECSSSLLIRTVLQALSPVQLFVTPWTAAHQASLSFTMSQSLFSLCPLSQWCHPTISSSVIPFSSCLQSYAA